MSSLHKNIPGVCFAVLLLFCTISFIQSSPASTDEVIKRFISNHIPVENQNRGISQSPVNGFIYFANSEGLIEYNGISRKTKLSQQNILLKNLRAKNNYRSE